MAKKHWIYIKRGLSEDPKHRAAMGECIWLYMHIIDRADWETGIAREWKDEQEAAEMGMPVRTLREQRRKLDELDYITCQQRQYGQDIIIKRWIDPRNYSGKVLNQGGSKASPQGYTQGSSQDVTPTSYPLTPTLEQINFLKTAGLEWLLLSGQPITQDVIDNALAVQNAKNEFEKTFGFGTLPWASSATWTKFEKFIVSLFEKNPGWMKDYVLWRENDGKYKAFSNRKIRENPAAFMDTGYPEYEAGKMYRKTDEQRPEYKPLEPQKGNYVPNPNPIKPADLLRKAANDLLGSVGLGEPGIEPHSNGA